MDGLLSDCYWTAGDPQALARQLALLVEGAIAVARVTGRPEAAVDATRPEAAVDATRPEAAVDARRVAETLLASLPSVQATLSPSGKRRAG
jgi:hypothetical protein